MFWSTGIESCLFLSYDGLKQVACSSALAQFELSGYFWLLFYRFQVLPLLDVHRTEEELKSKSVRIRYVFPSPLPSVALMKPHACVRAMKSCVRLTRCVDIVWF